MRWKFTTAGQTNERTNGRTERHQSKSHAHRIGVRAHWCIYYVFVSEWDSGMRFAIIKTQTHTLTTSACQHCWWAGLVHVLGCEVCDSYCLKYTNTIVVNWKYCEHLVICRFSTQNIEYVFDICLLRNRGYTLVGAEHWGSADISGRH